MIQEDPAIPHDPAVQRYLRALDSELAGIPDASRRAILDDVRAHLADAIESGREPAEALAGLGTPGDVARDAREQFGVAAAPAPADRAARILHIAAVALAVVTAVFVSFLLPSYAVEEVGVSSDGTGSTLQTATTLFEQAGLGVALLPLIPAALALLPLLLPASARRPVAWANAAVVTAGCVVAGFTIGGFFIPLALLLWAAALVPAWARRGGSRLVARIWRTVGALVLVAPGVYALGGVVTGTLMDGGAPFWITLLIVVALGVLFALRTPFIDVVVAALGAALMVLAVVDAGLLLLAFWWAGGLWLVIGISAAVGRRASRHAGASPGTERVSAALP